MNPRPGLGSRPSPDQPGPGDQYEDLGHPAARATPQSPRSLRIDQRRRAIAGQVQDRRSVRASDLAAMFDVAHKTIRRDLDVLAHIGIVHKVHGGAVASTGIAPRQTYSDLRGGEQAEDSIAATAARLLPPGGAIALAGGPETLALARRLADTGGLTVVTNSIPVADLFWRHRARAGSRIGPTVILTGGTRIASGALAGPLADQVIRSLHVETVFLGCDGLSVEAGLSARNLIEAETNRMLAASGGRVVVLADHPKWGVRNLATVAPLSAVDVWVTGPGLSAQAYAEAADHVSEIHVADP